MAPNNQLDMLYFPEGEVEQPNDGSPVLRDYQSAQRDSIFEKWQKHRSVLLVSSVGSGKTTTFCRVAKDRLDAGRVLVLAHRDELIRQAYNRFGLFGITPDVEKADERASHSEYFKRDVVVGTVQTLSSPKRLARFDPNDFGTLIYDEAHHCTSPSYRRILEHFLQNPNLKALGVTGTPDRSDEEALGQIFEAVAEPVFGIEMAIAEGWLVEPLQQFVEIEGLDFSNVATEKGDLKLSELQEIMEKEENCQAIADSTRQLAEGRPTLIFAASVKEAELISDILNRHEAGCSRWVCGKTPTPEREDSFESFRQKRFQYFCNVGVMTEGTDLPFVEVIANARPTKSRALYEQINGRALRVLPGLVEHLKTKEERLAAIAASPKAKALLIDFVGNSGRHKLMTVADILGGNISDEVLGLVNERIRKAGKPASVAEEIERIKEELRKKQERRERERTRRAGIVGKASFETREVNPFDDYDGFSYTRGWSNEPPSPLQCAYLRKRGFQQPEKFTKRQASAIISKEKAREASARKGLGAYPSDKQEWTLINRCGFSREQIEAMSFATWKGYLDSYFGGTFTKPVEPTFTERLIHETQNEYEIGAPAF
ncbi:MAG: DEAD/DEAH box helicase [Patescibacteria group bacterium]|nr:DEAD/DEAH box helicase [Patescibacteria group bacterium]